MAPSIHHVSDTALNYNFVYSSSVLAAGVSLKHWRQVAPEIFLE